MKNVWEAPQAIPEQRFPFRHYLNILDSAQADQGRGGRPLDYWFI